MRLLRRHADAGVVDFESEGGRAVVGSRARALGTDVDAALRRELQRVAHQVLQDLAQPRRVAQQSVGYVVGDMPREGQSFRSGLELRWCERLVEPRAQRGRRRVRHLNCPGLHGALMA